MIVHEDLFTFLEGGHYRVGLSEQDLHHLYALYENKMPELRREYFLASVPSHDVFIDGTAVSNRLVTVREFEAFVSETGYLTESEVEGWGWTWDDGWKKKQAIDWNRPTGTVADVLYDENNFPVMQVSWNDAARYCTWCSGKLGVTARLPFEYEWEVFSRTWHEQGIENAGTIEPERRRLDVYFEEIQWYLKQAGKYHITGVLWEWSGSWYAGYPGGSDLKDFGTVYRVLKGGSLFSEAPQKIQEYRFRRCPTARSPFYGFRIAVETGARR